MEMSVPTLKHQLETINGVTWHWVEAGDGDPIVLLHGIPESWQCWIHQIPTLATQFKVYAFDLKGYGQSDKAEGDYTMNNVAAELISCLDHLFLIFNVSCCHQIFIVAGCQSNFHFL